MNAYKAYQRGRDDNVNFGCVAMLLSWIILAGLLDIAFEAFCPIFGKSSLGLMIFCCITLGFSLLCFKIASEIAQKHWDKQWKDSCITRGGMKI